MNIWLMKTYKNWADVFVKTSPPIVGIDESGINQDYGNLNQLQRNSLFAQLQQLSTGSHQFGLIKRFFDQFYDEMAAGDIIALGTGQRTKFQVVAIFRVEGNAGFTPAHFGPRHIREVSFLWRGQPVTVSEWGYARRLEKLDTIDRYQEFIRVFTNLP